MPNTLTAASLASPGEVTVSLPPPRLNSHPQRRDTLSHGEEGLRHPTAPPGHSSIILPPTLLNLHHLQLPPGQGLQHIPMPGVLVGQGRRQNGCLAQQTPPWGKGRCCWMLLRPAAIEESPQQPQPSSVPQGSPPQLSISLGSSPGREEA